MLLQGVEEGGEQLLQEQRLWRLRLRRRLQQGAQQQQQRHA
jgi:hypothetical protein